VWAASIIAFHVATLQAQKEKRFGKIIWNNDFINLILPHVNLIIFEESAGKILNR